MHLELGAMRVAVLLVAAGFLTALTRTWLSPDEMTNDLKER